MSEQRDPRRRPSLDDEVDGLDCFAAEGAPRDVDEADDTAFAYEEVLPSVRVASPLPAATPARPARQAVAVLEPEVLPPSWIAQPPAWRRAWPETRVTAVAVALVLVGVIGMWMTMGRERPVPVAAVVAPSRPAASRPAAPSVTSTLTPPDTRSTSVARSAPAVAVPRDTDVAASTPASSTAVTGRSAIPSATTSVNAAIAPEVARPGPLEATPAVALEPSIVTALTATPELANPETTAEAASARAAIVAPPNDRASIERVLQQYRDAYDRLDAPSAAVIWPRVDTRALSRAFSTLTSQDLSFDRCDLDITGVKASAQCTGEIRYVRRVGDQEPRVRRMSWSFAFERVSDRWQIAQVTAD